MANVYEIIHDVGNSVIGQFNSGPIGNVGFDIPHTFECYADNISDIIMNERFLSLLLQNCQANDVFSTSYVVGNMISTFPEVQTINHNHTRIDMVHGVGSYQATTPLWIGHFSAMISVVVNLFRRPQNINIPMPQNPITIRGIREMLSLFSVELGRSPSSIITTAIMYEMCLWNENLLRQVHNFYPMAKIGAVSNFREIYNGQNINLPFSTSYRCDNGNNQNVRDARRMLLLEEILTTEWFNILSPFHPLPSPNLQSINNFIGTPINQNQQINLRTELYHLGERFYGFPLV